MISENINFVLIIGGFLLLSSIFTSKFSDKLGIPTLVFFIILGILTAELWLCGGTEQDYKKDIQGIAKLLGVVTLTFILFSGGLETDVRHIYPVWRSGLSLSTIGAFTTAMIVGVFLYCFFPTAKEGTLPRFPLGILIGAIVASTDAAAVFSILRSRKIRLKANIGPLLELESGSNDVMVYFLMTFLLHFIKNSSSSIGMALPSFVMEMAIGSVGGLVTGYGMLWLINKINLTQKGLYPILTLAMIFLPYGIVNSLHGSGYLAVYIAGIVLGNRDFMHRKSIAQFYEGFRWLLEIGMFIALGLLANIKMLLEVAPLGLGLSLVLMLIARPVSVFVSLLISGFTAKQKAFISWVGLRGAVPIVFATYLYGKKGLDDNALAEYLFHLIFFIVLTSVLVQGSSLHAVAKRLGLLDKKKVPKSRRHVLEIDEDVKRILVQLELPEDSPAHEKAVVNLELPKTTLIVLVWRDHNYFQPRGSTILKKYDKLFVVVDNKKEIKAVKACLGL